jgi:hypothetical protein
VSIAFGYYRQSGGVLRGNPRSRVFGHGGCQLGPLLAILFSSEGSQLASICHEPIDKPVWDRTDGSTIPDDHFASVTDASFRHRVATRTRSFHVVDSKPVHFSLKQRHAVRGLSKIDVSFPRSRFWASLTHVSVWQFLSRLALHTLNYAVFININNEDVSYAPLADNRNVTYFKLLRQVTQVCLS